MAKFISIPVVSKGNTLINIENITGTTWTSATALVITCGAKTFTFTIAGATTTNAFETINAAILTPTGPLLVPVNFPTGVTCTAVTIG
jgi:hypothetical protein